MVPFASRHPTRKARTNANWLIPADLSKAEFGMLFQRVVASAGLTPILAKVHVFDEPHKRYSAQTGVRERHKHLVFKMMTPFAPLPSARQLAQSGAGGGRAPPTCHHMQPQSVWRVPNERYDSGSGARPH